jgi:hypothetical protein
VLVVYDIADLPSFDATTVFLQDIRKYARHSLEPAPAHKTAAHRVCT